MATLQTSLEANSDGQADNQKKPLIGARVTALPKTLFNFKYIRVLIEHDYIQSMTHWIGIPSLMNFNKTSIYAGNNLSMKFPSRMQRGIHWNWDLKRMRISKEMRLRRLKLKNRCHERSFVFAVQSKFKLKEINEEGWTKRMGRHREMRLRRLKLKNRFHERSFVFAVWSKFKLKEIHEENKLGSLRGSFYP